MKLYEMQIIAEKNCKSLILADCSYICFAGGKVRRIKTEDVGAWGWCLYCCDTFLVPLKDLSHESHNIEWYIDIDSISEIEVDADSITITDDDIIIKYVEIPVNEPVQVAASYDGKVTVNTCYGDGYIVHKQSGDTVWHYTEDDAMDYIKDYENNQD